jgi:hypothetical protein
LIQTPGGRRVLLDGGARPQLLFRELGAAMPFWEQSLDLAVLTQTKKGPAGPFFFARGGLRPSSLT